MKYLVLSLLLLCFVQSAIARQQEIEILQLNNAKTVHLEAGQIFKYHLNLQKGQFASVKVLQKSVGIGYAVYTPGDSLIIYEDLNALYQTEVININAYTSGNYRVEIFWDYGNPQSGEFIIKWDKLEATGKTAPLRAAQLMKSWYPANEPGAAVAVVQHGKVIFKSTNGLANMEHGIPISSHSPFDLASCSKQFTGFAIAMLIDKGVISLEDDIRKYLPELPDFGKKITVEHLIYHTSGLRNWDAMSNSMGFKPEDVFTVDMIYKMICNTAELNFTPNQQFAYNNTGYNLLALIVEKATGQPFGDWMRANIFIPLRMENSLIRNDVKKVIPHKVSSYKKDKDGFIANPDNVAAMGSSSIFASIDDLTAWVTNFESGKAGGKNVLKLLTRKTRLNKGDTLGFYAFGNGFGRYKGIPRVEHLGLISGFRTAISRFPTQDLAVIFLSNDNNDAAYNRAWTIADVFLENKKDSKIKPVKFPDLQKSLAETMPFKVEKYPVDIKEYEGIYYADEINSHYKLIDKEGVLTAISYRFDEISLQWKATDSFSSNFQTFGRTFEFVRDEGKLISAFKLTGGDKEIVFRKLR
ncbi:MAG TPA: serine hydrolase domain-containing protein [Chitinophaga sp.]